MKHILLVSIFVFFSTLCLAEERDESEIFDIHQTDVEMHNAMIQANESLDIFIDRFNNQKEGDSNFSLKVMVTDVNGVEHFWVTDLKITKTGFEGLIANEPKTVKLVTMGQKVNFERDIVTDWLYDSHGVMQGAFTLKVLLKRMPKDKADSYKQRVGWK